MVGIPDWSHEPFANLEQIAADQAAIDAELAEFRQRREQLALQEFEQVPSYVERFKLEAE
jgi:hypothetical protein